MSNEGYLLEILDLVIHPQYGCVAKWIRRWDSEPKNAGSNPATVVNLYFSVFEDG